MEGGGSHRENGTFTIIKKPEGVRVIGSKWIFAVRSDGVKKARLVALGCQQKEDGLGKERHYTPVAVRALFSLTVSKNLFIKYLDICTAYLNAPISRASLLLGAKFL